MEAYAYPVLGALAVSAIELPHILRVLEPIWQTKTETASRLRGRIESVLDFATVRGYRTGDNPARWRGHLDAILPTPTKIQKRQHHPAMPIDEVPAFMRTLRGIDGVAALALQFVILTAARSGEARGARWVEVDLDTAVWIVPGDRMKAGAEHRVPLSMQAVQLLRSVPRASEFVFPAPRGGVLSDMTMTAVMRRLGLDYVPHGFRSSFRDWCGERTNYPRELAEAALAHTLKNRVEAAYRRGDALERRRPLMQGWADFLDRVESADVLEFRAAAPARRR